LEFVRYIKFTEDLGIPKEYVVENLIFNGEKTGDLITSAMPPDGATRWFGGVPPDLSLVARYKGTDWIYTYLRGFYPDDSRPFGVNNRVFKNVSMPDILWELKRSNTEEDFNAYVRDIVNFLDYVGEPAKLVRPAIGTKVLGFLLVLLMLTMLVKREYWKDVKYGKWRAKS
jgi:ubiquinol-cytochrome c reductase cytochrome c1 subunit